MVLLGCMSEIWVLILEKGEEMKLWIIGLLAFILFWISMFLSDFILKHIKRSKIVGLLFILLAILIAFEFYETNQLVAGSSVFIGFTGARILMK